MSQRRAAWLPGTGHFSSRRSELLPACAHGWEKLPACAHPWELHPACVHAWELLPPCPRGADNDLLGG